MGTEQRMVVAKGPGLKLGFLVPTVNFSFTVLVTTMKVMKNICCCVRVIPLLTIAAQNSNYLLSRTVSHNYDWNLGFS